MPKKALIIGVNGVVGSTLAKQLIAKDWEVF
jgi:GDP-D-mannose dehydratase